jgi:opacity protein-like surface antigen
MKILLGVLCAAVLAAPVSGQTRPIVRPIPNDAPGLSLRPFVVGAVERFTADQTFDAVFGQPLQPTWGGGLQLAFRRGFYVDVTASRFQKTGERAFFHEGEGFGLGVPLRVKMTPLELTVGARTRATPTVFPYIGAGIGTYRYEETSEFDDAPFNARHNGYLVVGGVEARVDRWFAVSLDLQYTRVPGIIGSGGVSQEIGEDDLGGFAGRFRVIVGR